VPRAARVTGSITAAMAAGRPCSREVAEGFESRTVGRFERSSAPRTGIRRAPAGKACGRRDCTRCEGQPSGACDCIAGERARWYGGPDYEMPRLNRAKAKFLRWIRDALEGRELERHSAVFSRDVVLHGASGETRGVDALNAMLAELLALEGRTGRLAVEGAGDQLVARYELRGRHTRPLFGVEPTGQALRLQGIALLRTEEECIVEVWHTISAQPLGLEAHSPTGATVGGPQPWARRWGLTGREARVAELAMAGHGDKQIAAELELAPTSVSKYLRRVLRKANVSSRAALAERAGLVRLG
jgi:DNA-binding CsgD family transcriptional regulator/predicted ester cyclase